MGVEGCSKRGEGANLRSPRVLDFSQKIRITGRKTLRGLFAEYVRELDAPGGVMKRIIGVLLCALLLLSAEMRLAVSEPSTAVKFFGRGGQGKRLDWSPDGRTLAALSFSGVALWDGSSGQLRMTLAGPAAAPVQWSSDGRFIVTANNAASLWDAATGRLVRDHLSSYTTADLLSVACSPSRDVLVMRSSWISYPLELYSESEGTRVKLGESDSNGAQVPFEWSPDGSTLATAYRSFRNPSQVLALWDASGNLKTCLTYVDKNRGGYPAIALAWSPDGRTLATSTNHIMGGVDPGGRMVLTATVELWDISTGQHSTLRFPSYADGPQLDAGFVSMLAWSPDGRTLAMLRGQSVVKLWDVDNGRLRTNVACASGDGRGYLIHDLAWSPDSRMLATAYNGGIALWDGETGNLRTVLHTENRQVNAQGNSWDPSDDFLNIVWGVNGTLASWSGMSEVRLWDGQAGKVRATCIIRH